MFWVKIIGIIYLIVGFVYALDVSIRKVDIWKNFPINMLGGSLFLLYRLYKLGFKEPPLE